VRGIPILSRRKFLAGTAAGLTMAAAAPFNAAQKQRLIADSQTHIWLPNTPDRPWRSADAKPQMPQPFTLEMLIPIIDAAGVDRVVLIPPSWEGMRNDYVEKAVNEYPGRFGVMGLLPLNDQEKAKQQLATWRDKPGFLGVRQGPSNEDIDWFWAAAEKHGIPICFLASGHHDKMSSVAEKFPGLSLIVDHMGISEGFMKAHPDNWQDEIKVVAGMAKYPNVSVKLSSAPFISSQSYPWRDTIPHIHRLYDAFGPLRCFWGTDQTHSFEKATYSQRITQFTEELPFLSESDKDWIMGRALLACLRWA
jgi:predicted TIM-barrel fold metal-dependent hydrolase